MNLRWAKDTRCMERTPGTSSSLCVRTKNWQISDHGEWYANCSWTAQCRFAVLSTHTRIWFASSLRTMRRNRVYEALEFSSTSIYQTSIVCIPFSLNQYTSMLTAGTCLLAQKHHVYRVLECTSQHPLMSFNPHVEHFWTFLKPFMK